MNTEEKIKHFLENSETLFKRSLIIDDEWGTGKSTIVKNLLSGRPSTSRLSLNTNIVSHYKIIDVCDIEINHDFIAELYISSNKINTNTNDITDKTKKITSWLAKKGSPMLKELDIKYLNIFPTATSIITSTIMEKSSFNKHVLVIDELERCTDYKKMEWLLLKISKLQENFNIKIIIIMNSKKLDESVTKLFNEWKEKISSLQINIMNDFFSSDNTPEVYKNHKNRNIRLIEKYKIIEKIIDCKLNEEIINHNTLKNNLINEQIQNFKEEIYDLYCEYYTNSTNEYQPFLQSPTTDYIKYPHLKEINIKELDNCDYEFIYYKINKIVKQYHDKNEKINNGVKKFIKEILHKTKFKIGKKQKENLKQLAIHILKNDILKNEENFNIFTFDSVLLKSNGFDEYCIFSYLNFMEENFELNNSDKKYFSYLLIKTLESIKKNYKHKNIEHIVNIWAELNEVDDNKGISRYRSLIINSDFILENDKKKILNKLNKLLKSLYHTISGNIEFDYNFGDPNSGLYEFHIMYNENIINLLYNKNGNNIYQLEKDVKKLKTRLEHEVNKKLINYNKEGKEAFIKMKLKKIKDFHNLNLIQRKGNVLITKENTIIKLKNEFFNRINFMDINKK